MIIQLEKMNEVFISAIDSFLGFRFLSFIILICPQKN